LCGCPDGPLLPTLAVRTGLVAADRRCQVLHAPKYQINVNTLDQLLG
jgi:hypothetical protein